MPGRRSGVAKHERRAEIERDLRNGVSCAAVGSAYGLGAKCVQRHARKLRDEAAEEFRRREGMTEVERLCDELDKLHQLFSPFLDEVRCRGVVGRDVLKVTKEVRGILRDTATIRGIIREGARVSVTNTVGAGAAGTEIPVARVRLAIARALQPYPDARAAVARELLALADGSGAEPLGEPLVVEYEPATPEPRRRRRRT